MVDDVRAGCRGLVAQPRPAGLETREESRRSKSREEEQLTAIDWECTCAIEFREPSGWDGRLWSSLWPDVQIPRAWERFGGGSLRVSELTGVAGMLEVPCTLYLHRREECEMPPHSASALFYTKVGIL